MRFLIITIFLSFLANPVLSMELSKDSKEAEFQRWALPSWGADPLVMSPKGDLLWTLLRESHELISINCSDGSIVSRVELDLTPVALTFAPDGSVGFVVGEAEIDRVMTTGIIEAFDPSNGRKLARLEVNSICNAVCAAPGGKVFVAAGTQYGYPGTVYMCQWNHRDSSLKLEAEAIAGKIPWAIAVFRGNLYVADSELQWTLQPDGSQGPPYGMWIWVYEADTLEPAGKIWVGIQPKAIACLNSGILVACSGSKLTQGQNEPTLVFIKSPDPEESRYIFIDSTGATSVASPKSGDWAIVTLADWTPEPSPGPSISSMLNKYLSQYISEIAPDLRRWVYTGDIGFVDIAKNKITTSRVHLADDAYLRSVTVSPDGKTAYFLEVHEQDRKEYILAVPVELLRSMSIPTEFSAPS